MDARWHSSFRDRCGGGWCWHLPRIGVSRADDDATRSQQFRRTMLTPTRGRGTDGNHFGLHIAGTWASVSVQRAAPGIVEPRPRNPSPYAFHGHTDGAELGFTTDAIDPRIEALAHDDWKASNPRAALKMAVDMFCRRAAYEVSDVTDAVTATRPDALLVDINTWGAMSAADAGDIPWAVPLPTPTPAVTWWPPSG